MSIFFGAPSNCCRTSATYIDWLNWVALTSPKSHPVQESIESFPKLFLVMSEIVENLKISLIMEEMYVFPTPPYPYMTSVLAKVVMFWEETMTTEANHKQILYNARAYAGSIASKFIIFWGMKLKKELPVCSRIDLSKAYFASKPYPRERNLSERLSCFEIVFNCSRSKWENARFQLSVFVAW